MTRPRCCRRITGVPCCRAFGPAGMPAASPDEVLLSMDEFEAVRLADLEGLYHEQAAESMNVSRQTFGRIIQAARGKIAKVLVEGLTLRIEEGEMQTAGMRSVQCPKCRHRWNGSPGTDGPAECPACGKKTAVESGGQRAEGETEAACPRRRCRKHC